MIWKEFAGAVVRWLIGGIAVALVARGVIGEGLAARIIEPASGVVVGLLVFIIPILWKIAVLRWKQFQEEKLFLANPNQATRTEVAAATWKEHKGKFILPL